MLLWRTMSRTNKEMNECNASSSQVRAVVFRVSAWLRETPSLTQSVSIPWKVCLRNQARSIPVQR